METGKHVSRGEFSIVMIPLICAGIVAYFVVALVRSLWKKR